MSVKYFIAPDTVMPYEDVMSSPHYAETIEQCALLCEQHNTTLKGGAGGEEGGTEQSYGSGYSFQYCNGFVYDTDKKQCALKRKQMGNFQPQEGPTPIGFYNPNSKSPRYYSGYRWNALANEINDEFPNAASGMQFINIAKNQATWSNEDYGKTGNFCTRDQLQQFGGPRPRWNNGAFCSENEIIPKVAQYDVRPGAIFSSSNNIVNKSKPFSVHSMQECADAATKYSRVGAGVPYSGSNAFTFWPEYTSQTAKQNVIPGMCTIGHVREPFYQTLTPHDNAAISGMSLTSLSGEIHRFLFG